MKNIDLKTINTIRGLSADMIQKANSGHPGTPLGAAPTAYTLWDKVLHITPDHDQWINRDRFILSAGHASAMLYSLLHLYGYDVSCDEMVNFRQLNSKTPGHPEYGHTQGVEATTGPLGAGMGMAVGMAVAEKHLAAIFNKPGYPIFDHYVYSLGGDGCFMEGISTEAFSFAGTNKLDNLIIIYDSNRISIEGSTDITFTENVPLKMEALGFKTFEIEDGDDIDTILSVIEEAKQVKGQPSFIKINTKIGRFSPKEGSESSHGEPLGVDNVAALKKTIGLDPEKFFAVDDDVYAHTGLKKDRENKVYDEWVEMLDKYFNEYPDMKSLWDQYFNSDFTSFFNDDYYVKKSHDAVATRNVSGNVLNSLKDAYPQLMGGSADLGPSTKTYLNGEAFFSPAHYEGRNIHFGVREMAMAAIANGMMLYGGLQIYVSTFFTFCDFLKPMARMSALMKLPLLYIFTHDSIGVGEDGPTHQPVEQLTMLRSIPNFRVFRPCDEIETKAAYEYALTNGKTPTAIICSRQNLDVVDGASRDALKGGYIIDDSIGKPEVILLASGSEVSLAINTKKALNNDKIRIVSMPSIELFRMQDEAYKESVLPSDVEKRIAVEAGSRFSWGELVGYKGDYLTVDDFGLSAPANVVFKEKGFTVEHLSEMIKNIM